MQGEWERGLMHGTGVLVSSQGDHYKGGFRRGLRHGQGSLQAADGTQYSGGWKVPCLSFVRVYRCPHSFDPL